PMSKPRYICVESQAITSPPTCRASHTANFDFPEAVGPTMTTRGNSRDSLICGTTAARHELAALPARLARSTRSRALVAGPVSCLCLNRMVTDQQEEVGGAAGVSRKVQLSRCCK